MAGTMNVMAMFTGNADSVVRASGVGSEAVKKFKDSYGAAGGGIRAAAAQIKAAVEQEAAAVEAASAAQKAAIEGVSRAAAVGAAAQLEASKREAAAQKASADAAIAAANRKKVASEASNSVINKVALGSVAALAVVAAGSLAMAGKFEKSTQLLMTAGGESAKNMQLVRDGILQISESTGVSAENLSEGMYTVEKATYRGAAGLLVLKAAAQGAAAENVDMGTMTNALTSIMMSYHLSADKAISVTNELVAGAGSAKTTMQEYAGSLSTVLPVASAAGVSFAQVGGAIATLTQHGTSANESTQELANTIRGLQAPNNVAVNAMNQLGLSSTDISTKLGSRGLTGTIQLITDTIAQKLGPAGLVVIDTMKKSATATADLQTMISKMPAPLAEASRQFLAGSLGMKDFQQVFKNMGASGYAQGQQFLGLAKTVAGYNDQIKAGGPAAQTATAALKAIMGGATGMNTALMLGGENMKTFKEKTDEMTAAANRNGQDISTNAATQSTLAATTERVKATFAALTIQLGTVLMPVMKNVLDGILQMVKFFQENRGAAEALGLIIGGLATAFIVTAAATKAWAVISTMTSIATAVLTGNMTALSIAMDANPIGFVVIALTALVAGVIWAYNNIGWFKDAVNAAWKWIKEAFQNSIDWITKTLIPTFVDRWNYLVKSFTDTVGMFKDFFKNTVGMFKDWGTNTGGMVKDFTKNTVGMVKDWGTNTYGMFKDWGTKVGKGFVGWWHDPIGETKKFDTETSKVLQGWWDRTIGGFKNWDAQTNKDMSDWASKQAGGIKKWDSDSSKTMQSWWDKTWAGFKGWDADTSKTLDAWWARGPQEFKTWDKNSNTTLQNWWDKTTAGFKGWDSDTNKSLSSWASKTWTGFTNWYKNTGGVMSAWKNQTTGETRQFADDAERNLNNFNRTTDGMFKDFFRNTVGMFVDFGKNAAARWQDIMRTGQNAATWIGLHVFNPIKAAVGWVGDAFKNTADAIGTQWARIREATRAPAAFVVNTVYNNGIRAAWNGIASHVGLSEFTLPEAHMATGGIMPGYSPGVDNHVIAVGGGEAIMRPEWTRAVGAENVHAMNAMARGGNIAGIKGMMGFATGGIVGDVLHNLGNFFAHPLGGIKDLLNGAMAGMNPGGGDFGKIMMGIPSMFINKFADFASGKAHNPAPAPAHFGGSGGSFTGPFNGAAGPSQWSSTVLHALSMLGQPSYLLGVTLRRMNQESGGNPNAINLTDSNAAAGIPSKGLMQVIDPTFRAYAYPGHNTNIYDPLSNILASMNYAIARYGTLAGAYNQAGGYATGGVVPTLFDKGGYLKTGTSLVQNNTGAPERILGPGQHGLEGATIVLDIPELGGKLRAYVKDVIEEDHADANRALRNSAGVPKGGF